MSEKGIWSLIQKFFGLKKNNISRTISRINDFQEKLDEARGVDPNLPRGDKAIVCPFCQTRGTVRTKKKSQTSVGKGIGAALTFGASTIFTGLNKHSSLIQAKCSQCKQTWDIGKKTW